MILRKFLINVGDEEILIAKIAKFIYPQNFLAIWYVTRRPLVADPGGFQGFHGTLF